VLVRVGEFLDRPVERLEAQVDAGPGFGSTSPLHEALLASVPTPVLRLFRERLLGPLWEYDDRHNAELMTTLKAFLACDGSWSVCASRMYVHVNTVRYRISRVEALTGRDLSALADRVDFFLALRAA
jgi:DNA-binding PucR family transcriptional regulator